MSGTLILSLSLGALVVPMFGVPFVWRARQASPPTRGATWRTLGAACATSWILCSLADWPVVLAKGLIAALANTLFIAVPLSLVFCLPVAAILRTEVWRSPYVLWCVASCVVGIPLGLLSAVLIGCGYLQQACL